MELKLEVSPENKHRVRILLIQRIELLDEKITFFNKKSEMFHLKKLNNNYYDLLDSLRDHNPSLKGTKFTDFMNWFRYAVDSKQDLDILLDNIVILK